jgi:hypothetical protein
MKQTLLTSVAALSLLLIPTLNFSQAPATGTTTDFELFSSNGAVTNSGTSYSQVTGNFGTNNGSSTGFGNVNGQMHDHDGVSATCKADLLTLYNDLKARTATFSPSSTALGGGQTLVPGVYAISAASVLDLTLNLDGQNNMNSMFIFRINGTFDANANAKVKLLNQQQACNVYWVVEGKVMLATGVSMKGSVIANNAAIDLAIGDTLEGRAMSTTGAVTTNGVLAYTPTGCGSPVLNGPGAPFLGTVECYGLFSATGAISNSGTTFVKGDVGSNTNAPTGFQAGNITGTLHMTPDASTAQCASDLNTVYLNLSGMTKDIQLLYPAQFGHGLVLTPHIYLLNAATVLTDTVYLNAQNVSNAVFVIKSNGALSTSTNSKVILINGAQAKNVFWVVEGAVSIAGNSVFCGTLITHGGAVGALATGVVLNGRALATAGAMTSSAVTTTMTPICGPLGVQNAGSVNEAVAVYPNPFSTSLNIVVNEAQVNKCEMKVYTVLGALVMNEQITKQTTALDTNNLPSGIYFYQVTSNDKVIQSGKLISKQ